MNTLKNKEIKVTAEYRSFLNNVLIAMGRQTFFLKSRPKGNIIFKENNFTYTELVGHITIEE